MGIAFDSMAEKVAKSWLSPSEDEDWTAEPAKPEPAMSINGQNEDDDLPF